MGGGYSGKSGREYGRGRRDCNQHGFDAAGKANASDVHFASSLFSSLWCHFVLRSKHTHTRPLAYLALNLRISPQHACIRGGRVTYMAHDYAGLSTFDFDALRRARFDGIRLAFVGIRLEGIDELGRWNLQDHDGVSGR